MAKTVLVTGASRGLGRELALTFARNQWDVIAHGRNKRLLSNLSSELHKLCCSSDIVVGDLRSQETIDQLGKVASQRNLDILINNAGVYVKKSFHEMNGEEIRGLIETNLTAPILLTREIYPLFQQKHSGVIVNVNSLAGLDSCALESIYCAGKQGLRGFSDALKIEADQGGVVVMDFYPGAMQTDMTLNRPNYADLMRTNEVASLIYRECAEVGPSMRVDRIVVRKRSYKY